MYPITRNCSLISGILIVLFSFSAVLVNHFFFHYPGNNYLPNSAYPTGFSLLLILVGVRIYLNKGHYISELTQSVVSLYLVMAIIALLTNAVQFTPFAPIDKQLLTIDHALGINTPSLLEWIIKHSWLQYILVHIYDSLPFQMAFLPLIVAISGKFNTLREYFCLMLVSALIGFIFYYFFPTTAPASNIISPYFSEFQHMTGIKFSEIHHYITPSTIEGGMIAMPSFHTIWAWFCIYLVRSSFLLFIFILPVNILLIISCVLLGWHYFIDLIGSLLVILISHGIHYVLSKRIN